MNWKLFALLRRRPMSGGMPPRAPVETGGDVSADASLVLNLSSDPTQPDLFDEIAKAQALPTERGA